MTREKNTRQASEGARTARQSGQATSVDQKLLLLSPDLSAPGQRMRHLCAWLAANRPEAPPAWLVLRQGSSPTTAR